jgi:hypothetical protein
MPTGYTSDIAKGISFEEFALGCARAFGACIDMRDDPMDTPIPEKFEPSSYNTRQYYEAVKEKKAFDALSQPKRKIKFEAYRDEKIEYLQKSIAEKKALKKKYKAMLEKAKKFDPPTKEHVNFKNFMISQLNESMDFDCDYSHSQKELNEALTYTGGYNFEIWEMNQLTMLARDIEYHKKEQAEENERACTRTDWVKTLRAAIKKVR